MPQFTRRVGGADLKSNIYYNEPIYCGKYPFATTKLIQCALWAICRTGEISEQPITAYNGISNRTDILKPIFSRNGYGNAKEWWNDTLWEKTTKADEVKLGDIVCYGSAWGGGYGHVRIIEAIDDNYFYCSGGNEDGNGLIKYNIKIAKQNGGSANGLMGYIHNPFLSDLNHPTSDKDIEWYKIMYQEEKAKNEQLEATIKQIKDILGG